MGLTKKLGGITATAFLFCLPAASLAGDSTTPANTPAAARSTYTLGPDDEVFVTALHVPEITNTPIRIDPEGNLSLPLVGRVRVAGLTVPQAEAKLADSLAAYVKEPEVSIRVAQMRSQPVSVLGAVRQPGVIQLQGERTLVQVISEAGGLQPDAGYTARITRRFEYGPIPVPGSRLDASQKFYVADVSLSSLLDGSAPGDNLRVLPQDVISVPRAEMVYVMGDVQKPGAFVLHSRDELSVIKAISLAEGTLRTASLKNARIIRTDEDGHKRSQIPVDVNKVLEGKAADPVLRPEDILFVPNSASKSALVRGMEAAIQIGTGVAIFRH